MKKPRLFYYEEGVDAFCPVPDNFQPEHIGLSLEDMDENDPVSVKFVRSDMTDKEFDEIPEE